MSKTYDIKFAGIDYWNRVGFKVQGLAVYLGDVNKLWNYDDTKEDIDAYYKEHPEELCVFGSTFDKDHDPLGTSIKKDIILNII